MNITDIINAIKVCDKHLDELHGTIDHFREMERHFGHTDKRIPEWLTEQNRWADAKSRWQKALEDAVLGEKP